MHVKSFSHSLIKIPKEYRHTIVDDDTEDTIEGYVTFDSKESRGGYRTVWSKRDEVCSCRYVYMYLQRTRYMYVCTSTCIRKLHL